MKTGKLKVWSGECCLCEVGIKTNFKSTFGKNVDIHTGDIVLLWHVDYLGTDHEEWNPLDGLTVVVTDKGASEAYVRGIKSAGFSDPSWGIQVVKKYLDVVAGEHWPDYGFRFDFLKGDL